MKKTKTQIIYLSHGGGPLPLLGDEGHREMVENLEFIAGRIRKPSAIILISAHWEEKVATITSAAKPSLIYDYYGFPEESYSIEYPCSGLPALAEHVHGLLSDAGIESRLDKQRGFDHGLFVPLKIMYPEADIPCIQLSLVQGLNPEKHLDIGTALADRIDDDVLIIGSGFSFHNMKEFFAPITEESVKMNGAFQQWLIDTFADSGLDSDARMERLKNWQEAPFARYCHPREEHLLPLHVCYGIAQKECSEYFEPTIINKKSSTFLW